MVPFNNYPPENEIGNTKTKIASVQITKSCHVHFEHVRGCIE